MHPGFIQLNCMGMCDHFIVKAGKEAGHHLTSHSSRATEACTLALNLLSMTGRGLSGVPGIN